MFLYTTCHSDSSVQSRCPIVRSRSGIFLKPEKKKKKKTFVLIRLVLPCPRPDPNPSSTRSSHCHYVVPVQRPSSLSEVSFSNATGVQRRLCKWTTRIGPPFCIVSGVRKNSLPRGGEWLRRTGWGPVYLYIKGTTSGPDTPSGQEGLEGEVRTRWSGTTLPSPLSFPSRHRRGGGERG